MEKQSENYNLMDRIHNEGTPLNIKPLHKTISHILAKNRNNKSTDNNRETGNSGKSRRRRRRTRRRRKRRRRIKKSEKRKT